ncbi:copper chaperone PCu(A)C [Magnetovibrio sp. PR-2]|uniref:copper chaperone PCu(A)C n=1 Tax=Magnetovibrio sp. PR-2 TaxID=3120356 RepID=UPI002FCDEBEA
MPPDGRVELKPGGLHVMMMGLREPLKSGATLVLNLTFEKNDSGSLDVPIAGPGATRPPQ